jgi:hypothetical protein
MRMGGLWESNAVPDSTLHLVNWDAQKWGISGGGSWKMGTSWWIDVGYSFLWFFDRLIVNSEVKQVNPLYPEGSMAVGQGLYQGSIHLISVGMRSQTNQTNSK